MLAKTNVEAGGVGVIAQQRVGEAVGGFGRQIEDIRTRDGELLGTALVATLMAPSKTSGWWC